MNLPPSITEMATAQIKIYKINNLFSMIPTQPITWFKFFTCNCLSFHGKKPKELNGKPCKNKYWQIDFNKY